MGYKCSEVPYRRDKDRLQQQKIITIFKKQEHYKRKKLQTVVKQM